MHFYKAINSTISQKGVHNHTKKVKQKISVLVRTDADCGYINFYLVDLFTLSISCRVHYMSLPYQSLNLSKTLSICHLFEGQSSPGKTIVLVCLSPLRHVAKTHRLERNAENLVNAVI